MINRDREPIVLFATEPRDKTITPAITMQVQTQAVLLPPNRSADGRQIGNPFIHIDTVGDKFLIQGERIEVREHEFRTSRHYGLSRIRSWLDSRAANASQNDNRKSRIRGQIDPVSVYQAMLLTNVAIEALVNPSEIPSMRPDMTYAQFLRSSLGSVLPVGTVMQSVNSLLGKREGHWFIALLSKALKKGRRPKERPLIDDMIETGDYTEEDLQNLVKQSPPKQDLRRAIRILYQHDIPVKGGRRLYVTSYLPEIQPRPRLSLRIPSPQS